MTPVAVPTTNRKLGATTCVLDLKLDKPLGRVYLSSETHLIKVVNTAPSKSMRADEIVIETANTNKVTVVVAVMSVFCRKK